MKNLLITFAGVFLFSCSKEKRVSIAGNWGQAAQYILLTNDYQWEEDSNLSNFLWLKEDGTYMYANKRCGVGADFGKYSYYEESNELRLLSFGNFQTIYKVSLIDDQNLLLENTDASNFIRKLKFKRR
jgi:hypothetical protein